jgi:hypothetical protein
VNVGETGDVFPEMAYYTKEVIGYMTPDLKLLLQRVLDVVTI